LLQTQTMRDEKCVPLSQCIVSCAHDVLALLCPDSTCQRSSWIITEKITGVHH